VVPDENRQFAASMLLMLGGRQDYAGRWLLRFELPEG
jgi:hypothetical protein